MSVDSIGAFAAQTSAAAATGPGGGGASAATPQLTESDFLSLLVAQMKSQDPTQPTDPNAFVQEMASLSEVSGINGVQTSIGNLASAMQSSQLMTGTSLIGHQVLAPGSTATLASGGTVSGAVNVPAGASAVQVQVADASGNVVRTFSVTPQAGMTGFTWDGLTSAGAAAPAGTYTFSVAADTNGTASPLTPLFTSTVNSLSLDPATQTLSVNTNTGTVPLSSVVAVN